MGWYRPSRARLGENPGAPWARLGAGRVQHRGQLRAGLRTPAPGGSPRAAGQRRPPAPRVPPVSTGGGGGVWRGSPRLGRAAEWEGTDIRAGKDAEGTGGPLVPLLSPITPKRPPPTPPNTHTSLNRRQGVHQAASRGPWQRLGPRSGAVQGPAGRGSRGRPEVAGTPPSAAAASAPGPRCPPAVAAEGG